MAEYERWCSVAVLSHFADNCEPCLQAGEGWYASLDILRVTFRWGTPEFSVVTMDSVWVVLALHRGISLLGDRPPNFFDPLQIDQS